VLASSTMNAPTRKRGASSAPLVPRKAARTSSAMTAGDTSRKTSVASSSKSGKKTGQTSGRSGKLSRGFDAAIPAFMQEDYKSTFIPTLLADFLTRHDGWSLNGEDGERSLFQGAQLIVDDLWPERKYDLSADSACCAYVSG
jgi:hypothetical protein